MEKMWAGRFSKALDSTADDFNSSLRVDCRMYREDIEGSMAHAAMLGAQGIISKEDADAIISALGDILDDLDSRKLDFSGGGEDIHMFVEAELTKRIGDAGKRLHTARSRNDQVALDIRLYLRREVGEISELLRSLMSLLCRIARANASVIMPGYTHLQRAQPVTFGHHMMAYAMMFERDLGRLADSAKRMNYSPLGCCALAGTTYPTDRFAVAEALNFDGITRNSLDGVSDRDFCAEIAAALSILMMHLSRFSEEIVMWSSWEFKFIELDDSYSTGSSIMPQKKNPDMAELIRGKTGRVYGDLTTILVMLKGIPLAYNKDMQEDKELAFDAFDTAKGCIALFTGMIDTMKFNKDVMRKSANNGFTNATDAADYLVKKGVPFRDAHGIVGRIVLYCIDKGIAIDDMSIDELKAISPVFEEDVFDAISMETCVSTRCTVGAPSKTAMDKVIAVYDEYMKSNWQDEV